MKRRRLALPVIQKTNLVAAAGVPVAPSLSGASSQSSKKAQGALSLSLHKYIKRVSKITLEKIVKQTVLNRHVFDVLEVLKASLQPFDRATLIRKLAYDVWESPDLFQLLCSNDKIVYDSIAQTFAFKVCLLVCPQCFIHPLNDVFARCIRLFALCLPLGVSPKAHTQA